MQDPSDDKYLFTLFSSEEDATRYLCAPCGHTPAPCPALRGPLGYRGAASSNATGKACPALFCLRLFTPHPPYSQRTRMHRYMLLDEDIDSESSYAAAWYTSDEIAELLDADIKLALI